MTTIPPYAYDMRDELDVFIWLSQVLRERLATILLIIANKSTKSLKKKKTSCFDFNSRRFQSTW